MKRSPPFAKPCRLAKGGETSFGGSDLQTRPLGGLSRSSRQAAGRLGLASARCVGAARQIEGQSGPRLASEAAQRRRGRDRPKAPVWERAGRAAGYPSGGNPFLA